MKGFIAICLALVPDMLDAKLKRPIQLALVMMKKLVVSVPFMIKK